MQNETFIYKGKRAQNMGIELRESIILSDAIPKVESIRIPGRNGDIQNWDGSYENRTITAKCYLLKHAVEQGISNINAWLVSEPGYFRFEDTNDQKHFMLARAVGGVNKQLRASVMSAFDIEFDADPRRFLKTGERKINLWGTVGGYPFYVQNPTAYPSAPLLEITVESDATYTFGLGGGELYIRSAEYSGLLYYDCENDRAYNENVELNELVASEGSLRLLPGINEVTVTSNKSNGKLDLYPRWWEI